MRRAQLSDARHKRFMFFDRFIVTCECAFGAADAFARFGDALADESRRLAQTLRALAVLFDLEQPIKRRLALACGLQKICGQSALWHADGGLEEGGQISARLNAEMLTQEGSDVLLLFSKPHVELRIDDVIACARVAIDRVLALVQVALERDAHRSFLRAAPEKIFFAVIEHIEERPRDGFEDGGLARAVWADNRGRARRKDELAARIACAVGFDVL